MEANPSYARIQFPGGRESNVSLRDLAPCHGPAAENPPSAANVDAQGPCPGAQSQQNVGAVNKESSVGINFPNSGGNLEPVNQVPNNMTPAPAHNTLTTHATEIEGR